MEKAFEPYVDGSTNTVIKVVGVGGAGGNALNTMVTKLTDCQVEFIAANTDRQALTRSLASEKISLGRTGLGAAHVRKSGSRLPMMPEKKSLRSSAVPIWSSLQPAWAAARVPALLLSLPKLPGTGYSDRCRRDKAFLL